MNPKASGIGHTSGNKPVWFNMENNNHAVPKENEQDKLKKMSAWTYAAQQAGAYQA